MCFGLSCLFACLLLLGSGKFDYSLVPTLISFRRTALPRVFSALSGFMPPKRTTRNSLSTYFDMASDPANLDLSPVSPGLPASSSSSAGLVNFVVSSSSASGLSLDSLTASIVNAIRPLLNSGRPSDQSAVLSLPAAAPRRLHPVFVCRAPACQWPLLVLAHNYQPLLAQVGLFWFRLLLIHLPCQQCRRLVCPPARLHHVLHLFPTVCQPHWFRHPFSSHSSLGPDSHRFLTK